MTPWKMITRGDRSSPFEIFVYDPEGREASITIALDPHQVVNLIANLSHGYASYIADKQIVDRPVDPPCSLEP